MSTNQSFASDVDSAAPFDVTSGAFETDDDPYADLTPAQAYEVRREQIRLRQPLGRRYVGSSSKTAESTWNPFLLITLLYTYPMQKLAERKDADLDVSDLDPVLEGDGALESHDAFAAAWSARVDSYRAKQREDNEHDDDAAIAAGRGPGLLACILSLYPLKVAMYLLSLFLRDGFPFVSVVLMKRLNNFITDPEAPDSDGYVIAVILFAALFFQAVAASQGERISNHLANRFAGGVQMAVVKHALRMTPEALESIGGRDAIFQYFATDIPMLGQQAPQMLVMVSLCCQVIGVFIYLGFVASWPAVGAVAVFLIVTPINYKVSSSFMYAFIAKMIAGDARSKKIVEILNNIRVVKMYGWEKPFAAVVKKLREPELAKTKQLLGLVAVLLFSFSVAAPIMLVSVYLLMLADNPTELITVTRFFEALTLINILNLAIVQIPFTYSVWMQLQAVEVRLTKLLLSATRRESTRPTATAPGEAGDATIEQGIFAWKHSTSAATTSNEPIDSHISSDDVAAQKQATNADDDKTTNERDALYVPSFTAARGGLTIVVGKLGGGKSLLAQGLVGELNQTGGTSTVTGKIAYTSQTAWVLNATIRNNIIMFDEFEPRRYEQVVRAVELMPDFAALPNGDLTEVGEKGVNLSGGQKQRLAMARALYMQADVYVFDDPLSALDAHVGRHVFDEAIMKLLAGKTRILITHALGFLPKADRVYLADGLEVTPVPEVPTPAELQSIAAAKDKYPASLVELMESWHSTLAANAEEDTAAKAVAAAAKVEAGPATQQSKRSSKRQQKPQAKGTGILTMIEEREGGRVSTATFRTYLASFGGIPFWVVMLSLHAITVAGLQYAQLMLGDWAGGKRPWGDNTAETYIGIYAAIIAGTAIVAFIRELVWRQGAVNAPRVMYEKMSETVFRTYMAFFDTTPMGRVINRFTKDSNALDFDIPLSASQVIQTSIVQLGALASVCYVLPWFTPVAVVLIFVMAFAQPTAATVVIRRLNGMLSGPLTSHFTECVFGASAIRAAGLQSNFEMRVASAIDDLTASSTADAGLFAAILFRSLCVSSILAGGAMAVVTLSRDSMSPARAAYVMSQVSSLAASLAFLVIQRAAFAMSMNSIERMQEYFTLKPEESGTEEPPADWPSSGEVQLRNVTARYREGTPIVLRNVTACIRGGEKVGVVGRTGSGKSSFLLALFRLIPMLDESRVIIDGVDISSISIDTLRQRLSVIPQDPVLFQGTVRSNLDPFESKSDDVLLMALDQCHLRATLDDKLEQLKRSAAAEEKSNEGDESSAEEVEVPDSVLDLKLEADGLSAGEKQLLCLARALARNQRVLVLDEATSSVDPHTDRIIQQTIRTAFSHCTVITVAHRINTILDSDRILALEAGRVVEFDAPQTLLKNPDGLFSGLLEEASRNQQEA